MTATAWTCKKCGAVLGWVRGHDRNLHIVSAALVVYRPRKQAFVVTCPACGERRQYTRQEQRAA